MRGPPEFLYPIILPPRRTCSSRTCSHIRGYAGIHLPMIKASALKSCRKNQPFFYTLMQEKIAAVFLKALDNNRIEPRTKIRYNSITVQREIPLKLPVFCNLFHLLETLDSLRRMLDYNLFLIGGDCLNQNIPRPASPPQSGTALPPLPASHSDCQCRCQGPYPDQVQSLQTGDPL